ncbi:MAG: methanogenesis marker 12 protein [Methanomicrobiales archaeon]|nr:methanogenesis marker 12 protein [Methanomicrobiales archaeon]
MFIGVDHGTTGIRFSSPEGEFRISREEAREFDVEMLARLSPLDRIRMVAVTYSMGDNFSEILPIGTVTNRGLVSQEGAGKHIGGGTRVFDAIAQSGIPAVVVPGLHRSSPTDPRFRVYSHQASPEKVGIAYEVHQALGDDFVVADVSSNTVTILVSGGRITGAIDACIFAPGLLQGALDVDAIRRVDRGECSANDAFQHAGVNYHLPDAERIPALSLFAAMEIAALRVLNPGATAALAGTLGPQVAPEVERLLGIPVTVFDEWCASRGLWKIARDVVSGKQDILGIRVRR